jgi:predicted RNase H-like HicB family nuclease
MLYPAYIHKDADSAYSASFPDFPGCFSAADELHELPRAAQEAVEVHFDGENLPIPKPSTPEAWGNDERYQGGYWMLIDIDLSKVGGKSVRVNISMTESLLQQIDAHAKARHMSRSAYIAVAAQHEMASIA